MALALPAALLASSPCAQATAGAAAATAFGAGLKAYQDLIEKPREENLKKVRKCCGVLGEYIGGNEDKVSEVIRAAVLLQKIKEVGDVERKHTQLGLAMNKVKSYLDSSLLRWQTEWPSRFIILSLLAHWLCDRVKLEQFTRDHMKEMEGVIDICNFAIDQRALFTSERVMGDNGPDWQCMILGVQDCVKAQLLDYKGQTKSAAELFKQITHFLKIIKQDVVQYVMFLTTSFRGLDDERRIYDLSFETLVKTHPQTTDPLPQDKKLREAMKKWWGTGVAEIIWQLVSAKPVGSVKAIADVPLAKRCKTSGNGVAREIGSKRNDWTEKKMGKSGLALYMQKNAHWEHVLKLLSTAHAIMFIKALFEFFQEVAICHGDWGICKVAPYVRSVVDTTKDALQTLEDSISHVEAAYDNCIRRNVATDTPVSELKKSARPSDDMVLRASAKKRDLVDGTYGGEKSNVGTLKALIAELEQVSHQSRIPEVKQRVGMALQGIETIFECPDYKESVAAISQWRLPQGCFSREIISNSSPSSSSSRPSVTSNDRESEEEHVINLF